MTDDARTLRRDLTRVASAVKQAQAALAAAAAVPTIRRTNATISGPFGPGNADVTVTWPTPWPDAGYGVWVSIISGTAALNAISATLKSGTKTANDCVITVASTTAVGTFALDVLGVRA